MVPCSNGQLLLWVAYSSWLLSAVSWTTLTALPAGTGNSETVVLLQVVLLLLCWHQVIGKCGVVLPFPLVFLESSSPPYRSYSRYNDSIGNNYSYPTEETIT